MNKITSRITVVTVCTIESTVLIAGTSSYKVFIKPLTKEDKQKIILKLEQKIKQFSSQNTFSQDYIKNNEEVLSCYDDSPYGIIIKKMNMFQN